MTTMRPASSRQRRPERDQIGEREPQQGAVGACLPQRLVPHHQTGDAVRREHDYADEQQAEIELPHVGEVAEHHPQPGDKHRADHRPDEIADAADIGGEQHLPRLLGADRSGIDQLEIDCRERAGDAGEQPGERKGHEAHHGRIVADELRALGILAHRVAHAAERRAPERIHRQHGQKAPRRDQIIDLDLRGEIEPEQAQQLGAVGGHPFLAAKEAAQDERARGDELAEAERDHGKRGAGAPRRHRAEDDAEQQAAEAADQRHQRERHRQTVVDHRVHGMHGEEAAQPVIDGVAEREQAGLAEQHVVGEREHDHDAHQAEHRQRTAGGKDHRQHREQESERDPRRRQPRERRRRARRTRATTRRHACRISCRVAQCSRVPIRPVGRKIRISTRSK